MDVFPTFFEQEWYNSSSGVQTSLPPSRHRVRLKTRNLIAFVHIIMRHKTISERIEEENKGYLLGGVTLVPGGKESGRQGEARLTMKSSRQFVSRWSFLQRRPRHSFAARPSSREIRSPTLLQHFSSTSQHSPNSKS